VEPDGLPKVIVSVLALTSQTTLVLENVRSVVT
jgi:hypothetical protein